MSGVAKIQSLKYVMEMAVEYKASHGNRNQLIKRKASLHSGFSLSRGTVTGHRTIVSYSKSKKAEGSMLGRLRAVTLPKHTFSPVNRTCKKRKNVFKDGNNCNQKGESNGNLERVLLDLFPIYLRLTHLTLSDIYKKCPAVNQTARMPIKFTELFRGRGAERSRS